MAIQLGQNQYGKAESRVVRVYRDSARHTIRDLNVSSALRGRFEDAHITGDQGDILPTDTQKNTAFSFAKEKGIDAIEDFGLTLADHFISRCPGADGARIEIEEYAWDRIPVDGAGHDFSFVQAGGGVRTTVVNMDGHGDDRRTHVVTGIRDLVLLKSTGSEFHGFFEDKYTTLRPTKDRVMATSLVARWRYDRTDVDWDKSFASIRSTLLRQFAVVHSMALQQTLYSMGRAVLEQHREVAEIKFSAPNKHHFLVDLSPFHVENNGEVFIAADRPYGLIEASLHRDDAIPAGNAWLGVPGFC
ncbi:urate oxidase [Nocardia sp. NBC_01503]|uniref:factor-independent urate hydroxylase n=1 Tax=Nocardia sp. NBC_01503 TaxID=2975997 RepID=UPI002E7BA8CF|nr:urate oxidase [Nocardia sp. NBC_01503]WTL30573.1 urate oxidase [Nocardia sp. NBC_01503]